MKRRMILIPSLALLMLLIVVAPVMAEQLNRLTFALHAEGSSIIFWDNTLQYSTGSFNFAGTSLAEETTEYGFPAYTIEEGSVYAAGDLHVKWTTNDGSYHELRVSLLSAKVTSGMYAVSEEAFGTDPFGICEWFQPYPLTYKGWHIQDGTREKISGTVQTILATCNSKDPDYSGTIVDKWWSVWIFLDIDGNQVGVEFTEVAIPNWCYGTSPNWQYAYVPAAQTLEFQIRVI